MTGQGSRCPQTHAGNRRPAGRVVQRAAHPGKLRLALFQRAAPLGPVAPEPSTCSRTRAAGPGTGCIPAAPPTDLAVGLAYVYAGRGYMALDPLLAAIAQLEVRASLQSLRAGLRRHCLCLRPDRQLGPGHGLPGPGALGGRPGPLHGRQFRRVLHGHGVAVAR